MPIFLPENRLPKNGCDEKARTCIFPFYPQPYGVLKNLTSNISPSSQASRTSALAPPALPFEICSLSSVKTWVRPLSKVKAWGFHPLQDFPSSLTSAPARHLVLYVEFNCLLLVTWILAFASKEHSKSSQNLHSAKRAWQNEKITGHFSLHGLRIHAFHSKYAHVFFPRIS